MNYLQKINIGVTDLSSHCVTASLVANILKGMGFEVNRIHSPHEDSFKKLKTVELDYQVSRCNEPIDAVTQKWLTSHKRN